MNKDNTENFKKLLMATKRTGIEAVLNWLEHATDFFTAPASTRFHGSYEGGLLEHSINTYNALKVLNGTNGQALVKRYSGYCSTSSRYMQGKYI